MIDIFEELNLSAPQGRTFRIDCWAVGEAMANAIAADMSDNLSSGRTPDGLSMMPTGVTTGRPRGQGTSTAASIHAEKMTSGRYVIIAYEDNPGTLARILRGVPFAAPDDGPNQRAVVEKVVSIATKGD